MSEVNGDRPSAASAEGSAIVAAANDTARPLAHDACLDVLFAAQAERSPDAVAVLAGEEATSYERLRSWSDGIAGRLAAAGTEPGQLVGVCGAPSAALVAAVLGVLRTGCAYVPLDPSWPAERLRFMAEEGELELVVCEARYEDLVREIGLRTVAAEEDAAAPAPPEAVDRDPGERAYVIYTSGSTGAPKGVVIPHRAVNRLISGAPDYVTLGPGSRFLWLSPLTFDASVIELWGPLLTGGAIVIMPSDGPWLERLAPTIRGAEVTAALFISPQLHMIVDRDPRDLEGIRHVLVGGDVLSADHVRRLLESGVVDEVVHCYGPTETTLFATIDVIREVAPGELTLPIGRPIENTTCHVVDAELEELPVGEEGELLIGGLGLANGYLNRPQLTRERFVPDPFSPPGSGRRLYRSGDLARWRDDGRLEFRGRIDDQVKIRGYRIEPAEIEAVLREQDGVEDCVVLAREDGRGSKRLVAYLAAPGEPEIDRLRDAVAERLPAYMVPAAWVVLDALPLTRNKKVDRAALPDPASTAAPSSAAPRGELEELVAHMFADILQLEGVGRDDGFFELGGDSLTVAVLLARLGEEIGVRLPLDIVGDAPTPATLARAMERARAAASEHPFPTLVPGERTPTHAVSASQEQICFLADLDPTSVAYQFQAILYLEGELDVAALEAALGGIVARHEVYRTTFHQRDGSWVAQVHDPFDVELPRHDLSAAEPPERALDELAEARFRERIAIDRLPLVRWRLVELGPARHALLHQEHHLVHDGKSMMNFLRELRHLYAAARGEEEVPPEPRLQFRDFAAWQRRLLESEIAERELAYWREQLAEPPEPLELPYDRPRSSRQTFRGDQICVELPAELAARTDELARSEGVTRFMAMFAAFAVLLGRYGGGREVIVGSGLANRRLRELDDMLGMFINTVALRVDLADDPTVRELVARVRRLVLEANENQDVPFPLVVDAVRPARSSNRTPLYQTLFSFADEPLPELGTAELEIVPDESPGNGSAKAEINVVVVHHARPGRASAPTTLIWEYNTDLFDPATAERMVRGYLRLLESLVENPGRRVSELDLLGDEERQRLLVEWNDTRAPYPREATIHGIFGEVARAGADRVALVAGEESITYGGLDRRSNRLARRLREWGVVPGARVGLAAGRSVDAVVALVAILKAGGSYVPLDPNDPPRRRELMIRDAGVELVLDAERLADPAVATESDDPVEGPTGAGEEAYVMYTSGSSGEPKGVSVSHRNVVSLVTGQTYAEFGPDEVFLQMAPLAFDASTFEIWGALLHGARLVLYGGGAVDLAELRATVARHGVTTLWLTAALFHRVVELDVNLLRGVGQLLAGGDVLLPDQVSRAMRALPEVRIVNGYGPTEATTFSCCFDATSRVPFDSSVPIGRPIANRTAFVLDGRLAPLPIGVAGDLYIGGDGVARRYVARPELTEERFVPNPFGEGRLYRTGDTARWRADGYLEFLGRRDLQVKIRGFRVELGEIEAALAAHPAVRAAAVVAPEDPHGDRRLVAHVATDGELDEAELESFLAERLPRHMIPSTFVRVERLPLTANGKVDRAALAEPTSADAGDRLQEPRDEVEQILLEIWAGLLGLEGIGVSDDFFELGGHSLLAMQVASQIDARLGVELTVATILEAPTVAELANVVESALEGPREATAPIIRQPRRPGPAPGDR